MIEVFPYDGGSSDQFNTYHQVDFYVFISIPFFHEFNIFFIIESMLFQRELQIRAEGVSKVV